MALTIKRGVNKRPVKCVIYGVEGIGKSTLAAQAPAPLFIDLEHGTDQMNVDRVDGVERWEDLLQAVREAPGLNMFRTVVIDTADAAERLCTEYTIRHGGSGIRGIEDFGYGKGYTYLAENYNKFLLACDSCVAGGLNVILIAHALQRKIELPDQVGAYDHWEMKLSKKAAPLVREWADMLLFMNYKTSIITTETKSKKAVGGQRFIYAAHSPSWDAKNRHGLPEQFEADWSTIAGTFYDAPVMKVSPKDQLIEMAAAAGVTIDAIMAAMATRQPDKAGLTLDALDDAFVSEWMIKYFDRLAKIAKEET